MKANRTALGIGAVVLALFGATSGVADDEPCRQGYFCIWTGGNWTGTQYQLYRCQEYNLYNWNGLGSWANNNTGGAHALIQDSNYRTLVDTAPGQRNGFLDFSPVWHIKAC